MAQQKNQHETLSPSLSYLAEVPLAAAQVDERPDVQLGADLGDDVGQHDDLVHLLLPHEPVKVGQLREWGWVYPTPFIKSSFWLKQIF